MQMWMAQLRKGLVELCVMAALQDDETYGYEIFQRPDGPRWLAMPEGVVYQVLRRLARDGFVRKRGGRSHTGPRRHYYKLTASGRARLQEMRRHWRRTVGVVNSMLR